MKYNTLAIAALVLPFLAACGQPVTGPNLNVVSGAITAMASDYSSITVAGQTLKLSGASLGAASLSAKATAPAKTKHVKVNGKEATEKALSVGQKVNVVVDANGEASEVDVDLEVRGAVTAVDTVAGTIVVSGRTVKLPTGARVDLDGDDDTAEHGKGKEALANLKVGDFVEVTGTTDANGDVVASKVEVKGAKELEDDHEDNHNEFRGKISGFVAGTTTFTMRGIAVTCEAPCAIPAALADGVVAEVEGLLAADQKTLAATSVKLLEGKSAEDQHDNGKPDDKSGSGK
jgi:hypothetical protein